VCGTLFSALSLGDLGQAPSRAKLGSAGTPRRDLAGPQAGRLRW
jgi:hypothetical protein